MPELQRMHWNRHENASLNIMDICHFNGLFTCIWNGAQGSCHDIKLFLPWQKKIIPSFQHRPGVRFRWHRNIKCYKYNWWKIHDADKR